MQIMQISKLSNNFKSFYIVLKYISILAYIKSGLVFTYSVNVFQIKFLDCLHYQIRQTQIIVHLKYFTPVQCGFGNLFTPAVYSQLRKA